MSCIADVTLHLNSANAGLSHGSDPSATAVVLNIQTQFPIKRELPISINLLNVPPLGSCQ